MYRVLIVSNETGIMDSLNATLDWAGMNFYKPVIAADYDQAIHTIETQRIDCIGYMLDAAESNKLNMYLTSVRPSLPVFQVRRELKQQIEDVREVRRLLDRLSADLADEVLDPETVLEMLREELVHDLLEGNIIDDSSIHSRLIMLRSNVSEDKPCVVMDYDLPQGEIYLGSRWHYGRERLENALRNNFFGKYHENIYYTVAVLNPCHIRVLACQRNDKERIDDTSLLVQVNDHVREVNENIKAYLNLDMEQISCRLYYDLYDLVHNITE